MSQSLLPDMELPKNMLPTILDMKNSNRVCVCVCVCVYFSKVVRKIEWHILVSLSLQNTAERIKQQY